MPLTDAGWKALDFVKIAEAEVAVRNRVSLSPYRDKRAPAPPA
ncbi:hypothetical protein CA12_26460 [Alienimonas californiensis]|uniref:Uncharacterized protein n=1 Tax=Alienimonas californiensis TaxID=2527989 RepID=A0A517PAY8_9PLAN|nr:hypothetical protein CA12_26460 [Alienimonas californiensis]